MKRCSPQVLCRRYRSALALNNIAVRLLERNCFEQAKEALLEGALPLMKTLVASEKLLVNENLSSLSLNNSGEALVQRAMQHLVKPRPASKSVMLFDVLTVTPDGTLVSGEHPAADADDDDSPSTLSCLESILQTAPCSYSAFPIRIEENLVQQDPSLVEEEKEGASTSTVTYMALAQQMAMLSHNLAIACLCQSKAITSSREARSLKKLALASSNSAYSALLKQEASVGTMDLTTAQEITCRDLLQARLRNLPCLLIAVLNSFIHNLHESPLQTKKARNLYISLVEFRSIAFDMERGCQQQEEEGSCFMMMTACSALQSAANDSQATAAAAS